MTILENEADFDIAELFFSRTDKRGIILSGNTVFQRISGYEWHEIMNRPHNIIRHPDMPRGVFYLLWETIRQKKPIGAYVKNQAKDGSFYWVFALVLPIGDDYLSVRLKPSSELFQLIPEVYKKVRDKEMKSNQANEESLKQMIEILKTLGINSYDEFMTTALVSELVSREKGIGRRLHSAFSSLEKLQDFTKDILKNCIKMSDAISHHKYVPLNLSIVSHSDSGSLNTLDVVAMKFQETSNEITRQMNYFEKIIDEIQIYILNAQFRVSAFLLQKEVFNFFENEKLPDIISRKIERNIIQEVMKNCLDDSLKALRVVELEVDELQRKANELSRSITSLEIIRISGKIEISKSTELILKSGNMLTQLKDFQTHLSNNIKQIIEQTANLHGEILGVSKYVHELAQGDLLKNLPVDYKEKV